MDFDFDLKNNKIQWVLDKRNMSQEELAEMVGMYQSDISEIINGKKRRFTLINAAKISIALGYSVEFLWPGLFKKI